MLIKQQLVTTLNNLLSNFFKNLLVGGGGWWRQWCRWKSRKTLSAFPLMNTSKLQLSACRTTIDWKNQNWHLPGWTFPGSFQRSPTTKDIKKEPQQDGYKEWTCDIIKPQITGMGKPQNCRIIMLQRFIHRSEGPEHYMRLKPRALALGRWALRAFVFEGQWGLIAWVPQDWGK